ncbi:MAG TPA: hypothetical protein PKD24_12890 [Pyrinomonadaceae bacterium]|nr:hypothetical protein [Pyrinomonadaceae bacterium]HMP65623.1 hypothetical protein [Pyrinomonadaceae bacterium]
MTLFDIAIIYFTFGAPVGMYSLLQQNRYDHGGRVIFKPLIDLVTWPRFAIRFLVVAFSERKSRPIRYKRKNLGKPITEPERIFVKLSDTRFSEFGKDSLAYRIDRFVGLSEALAEDGHAIVETTIFSISGHPNESVALECISRRNRNRLERHLSDARHSLMLSIRGRITLLGPTDAERLMDIVARVAIAVDDKKLLDLIRDVEQTSEPGTGTDMEISTWIRSTDQAEQGGQALKMTN